MMRAVFLDKDGTLIEDVPYNVVPERIRLMPGAAEGLRALYGAGYQLVVVSNQQGVGKGLVDEATLGAIDELIQSGLAGHGCRIESFRYCPHLAEEDCACRKPRPGLLLDAAESKRSTNAEQPSAALPSSRCPDADGSAGRL